MAFLLAPFLIELGAGAAATVTEIGLDLGLSSAASSAVGTGVVGLAAGEVANQAVSGALNAASKAIGQETVDLISNSINDRLRQALSLNSEILDPLSDPSKFLGLKPLPNPSSAISSGTKLSGGGTTVNFNTITYNSTPNQQVQDPDQIGPEKLNFSTIIEGFQNSVPKIDTKSIARFITSFASGLAINSLGTDTQSTSQSSQSIQSSQPSQPIQSSQPSQSSQQQIIPVIPPEYTDLSNQLGAFLSSKIPTTDEYKQIASIYNGKGLKIFQRYDPVTQGLIFTLIDETGARFELPQTKGTTIPPIYGVFMGPNSPNNALPIDLDTAAPLDEYCAFHDYDYLTNGFFDRIGDYKLVSRISQNYSLMTSAQKPYAKIAILYFSTLGHSISGLIGTLPVSIDEVVSDQPTKDDIFPVVIGPELANSLEPNVYNIERTKFYSELKDSFEVESRTSSVLATFGDKSSSKLLSYEFGEINITIN